MISSRCGPSARNPCPTVSRRCRASPATRSDIISARRYSPAARSASEFIQTTGFSGSNAVKNWLFPGGAIRFRIYSDYGLSAIDVAKICFLSGLTFWLGNTFVLGIGMAWHPWAASAMDQLPPAINRLIALGAIGAIVFYLIWLNSGDTRRELGQNGWKVVLPSAR